MMHFIRILNLEHKGKFFKLSPSLPQRAHRNLMHIVLFAMIQEVFKHLSVLLVMVI